MKLDKEYKEVESLRLKLKSWKDTDLHDSTDPTVFASNYLFWKFMRRERWINELLSVPFQKLPIILNECPEYIVEYWYKAILEWRLQLGK